MSQHLRGCGHACLSDSQGRASPFVAHGYSNAWKPLGCVAGSAARTSGGVARIAPSKRQVDCDFFLAGCYPDEAQGFQQGILLPATLMTGDRPDRKSLHARIEVGFQRLLPSIASEGNG